MFRMSCSCRVRCGCVLPFTGMKFTYLYHLNSCTQLLPAGRKRDHPLFANDVTNFLFTCSYILGNLYVIAVKERWLIGTWLGCEVSRWMQCLGQHVRIDAFIIKYVGYRRSGFGGFYDLSPSQTKNRDQAVSGIWRRGCFGAHHTHTMTGEHRTDSAINRMIIYTINTGTITRFEGDSCVPSPMVLNLARIQRRRRNRTRYSEHVKALSFLRTEFWYLVSVQFVFGGLSFGGPRFSKNPGCELI